MHRILLTEDNHQAAEFARAVLERSGQFRITHATSAEECLEKISNEYSLIILDLNLPARSGLDILPELRKRFSKIPVLVVTASSVVTEAVEAMRLGATNYLTKPVRSSDLISAVREATTRNKVDPSDNSTEHVSVTTSSASQVMDEVYRSIAKVAPMNISVLVQGATGSGKEKVARLIHQQSLRPGPLVAVNCPAIPVTLAESTLFGHEKGSFTGATQKQIGEIQKAHNGTLFLDEVADLPLDIQLKLLRVLEEKEVHPIGGNPLAVSFRLLCATSKDLQACVEAGTFREDLLYRLAEIQISLPSLAERQTEMAAFVRLFSEEFAKENDRAVQTFSPEAISLLNTHSWPGNLRELKSMVRRTLIMQDSPVVDVDAVRKDHVFRNHHDQSKMIRKNQGSPDASLEHHERRIIEQTLQDCSGNIKETAKILKISRTTLYRKMKKFGIAS